MPIPPAVAVDRNRLQHPTERVRGGSSIRRGSGVPGIGSGADDGRTIVPCVGDVEQLEDGARVLDALAHSPTPWAVNWRAVSPHVIDASAVKVFPIVRARGSEPAACEEFGRIGGALLRAGVHGYGGDGIHRETTLDPAEGYGARLAAAGVHLKAPTPAWRVHDFAVVCVRDVGDDAAVLSLHVIPAEWVWPRLGTAKRDQSRRRTMAKQLAAADPRWAWPDA
jgi:hypothetical protein